MALIYNTELSNTWEYVDTWHQQAPGNSLAFQSFMEHYQMWTILVKEWPTGSNYYLL